MALYGTLGHIYCVVSRFNLVTQIRDSLGALGVV
jgi:hypothetical protein